jgi:hypothetical protein
MSGDWTEGPSIDGIPGRIGDLVFRKASGREPWWIVEWQPGNGNSFAIVDAAGTIGVASHDELTRDFRKAGGE